MAPAYRYCRPVLARSGMKNASAITTQTIAIASCGKEKLKKKMAGQVAVGIDCQRVGDQLTLSTEKAEGT